MILCREEHAKKIDSAVFPGQQGGPLEHVVAGKAVRFRIAMTEALPRAPAPHRRGRAGRRARAAAGAARASTSSRAAPTCTSCWSTCASRELDGKQAEDRLHDIGITVNRNAVPFDPRPPMVTSGLRVGTPALATRGLQVDDFEEVGRIIAVALTSAFEPAATSWRTASPRSSTATRSTQHLEAGATGLRRRGAAREPRRSPPGPAAHARCAHGPDRARRRPAPAARPR